jgi:hypothetical protein
MHPHFNHGAEVRSLASVAWCGAASTHGASSSQSIDAAEARANARLIAAAPDLLAALHRISLASQNSMSSKEECGRIAREAIAKAKGVTP